MIFFKHRNVIILFSTQVLGCGQGVCFILASKYEGKSVGFFYYGILIFHSNISLPGTEILCGSNWATYKESDYLRTIDSNVY